MAEPFEKTLIQLVECELSPEEWQAWWEDNEAQLEQHLSRGIFLKLKPIKHGFRWVPVLTSQKGAIEYLSDRNIPFRSSDLYQQHYETELAAFCLAQKEQDKTQLEQLRKKMPELFRNYPKFAASLKNVYSSSDVIDGGAAVYKIEQVEASLGCQLPGDVKMHFEITENISIEGIHLELEALRRINIQEKPYIVLGEFWKEADGDLLLIKPEPAEICTVYYYAHGINSVKKLCSGIKPLIENKFSYYNRQ
ncbi:SMI1/KNR4 family protein [Paenibacillus tianjinensis]|uniref:SMI1/KNR4 family protein n=1 Tax=Paenibacillus tianjinensis TaxID=2810347 RepID=A0ABX7L6G8_9BACL|nr:SMI1/KNR4 family protein [Paenibacillus tianjinensis]QSF43770.1 SMI1/KNR4 family protein [Paenibacillus tianjinensis]